MSNAHIPVPSESIKPDLSAGLVVFLVALPLCLGIALASGAPLTSGIIAGVIGGVIVSLISGSPLSVSGPAAGLVVVCIESVRSLGSFEGFLMALIAAGALQILFGVLKLGILGEYVPSSVVRGMLAGIGLVIILKQIPHALGRDIDYEGNFQFLQIGERTNSFTEILNATQSAHLFTMFVSVLGIVILLLSDRWAKRRGGRALIPGQLIVVIVGAFLARIADVFFPSSAIRRGAGHFVELPVGSMNDFFQSLPSPSLEAVSSPAFLHVSVTIAIIASIESLLSVEAVDKLDPYGRISPPNRELVAQGTGNIISGALGGLPITAVILRSSANVYAGGVTRVSAIAHGMFLLLAVLFFPRLLNEIPLCALAAILLHLGYKLANPSLFREMYRRGQDQFLPFIATVAGILLTDLLSGVLFGLSLGLFYVLKLNHHNSVTLVQDGNDTLVRFNKDASFINKMELKEALSRISDGASVSIDGTKAMYIDRDIYDVLADFQRNAQHRGIQVILRNVDGKALPLSRKVRHG